MSKSRFAVVKRLTLGIVALALILTGTAQAQIAQMTLPNPGTTLTGASVTFTWTTGTNVQQYYLYVGSLMGGNDIYGQSQGTSTMATVNNLPTNGSTLYVRLWSMVSGVWHFNDYTYTAFGTGSGGSGCSTPALATMSSPPPGTKLAGASVSFSWTAGCDVTQYYLYVSTVLGGNDIYGMNQGTSTMATVSNLPTNGSTLYVRLWSMVSIASSNLSVGWHFNDSTYTAFGTGSGGSGCSTSALAAMSSPPPGTTLTGASVLFSWITGCDVTQYYLYVGTVLGGNDIYGVNQGTSTMATVTNLPTNGSTLFVRLWSMISGVWHFNDYTYTAFGTGSGGSGCSTPALATMSSPPPGTTLTGASVLFSWTAGCDVTQYYLYVGTVIGGNDIYGQSQGTSTMATVNNLPTNGSTLFVRLWSMVSVASSNLNVGWHFNDYTYTAFGASSGGTAPTVVSYQVLWGTESFNVIFSTRKHLPWQITGIRVVFSKPITAGSVNSLGGVEPTGLSGLGTNTLTWSISPIVLGNYATTLPGSGANALSDAAGKPLGGGAGFAQNVKVLYGDFNDDGAVNSADLVGINNATVQPYNIFADMNGDGTVSTADVLAARSRIGTSLP